MASHDVLDLTDEPRLLAEDRAEYDPRGVRQLLSALQLKPVGGSSRNGSGGTDTAAVFDLAVFRATGDRRLATLFGTAA
jgi:hypothetical protein